MAGGSTGYGPFRFAPKTGPPAPIGLGLTYVPGTGVVPNSRVPPAAAPTGPIGAWVLATIILGAITAGLT